MSCRVWFIAVVVLGAGSALGAPDVKGALRAAHELADALDEQPSSCQQQASAKAGALVSALKNAAGRPSAGTVRRAQSAAEVVAQFIESHCPAETKQAVEPLLSAVLANLEMVRAPAAAVSDQARLFEATVGAMGLASRPGAPAQPAPLPARRAERDEAPAGGGFGVTCAGRAECQSGLCTRLPWDEAGLCTKTCGNGADCPIDWDCKKHSNFEMKVCVHR